MMKLYPRYEDNVFIYYIDENGVKYRYDKDDEEWLYFPGEIKYSALFKKVEDIDIISELEAARQKTFFKRVIVIDEKTQSALELLFGKFFEINQQIDLSAIQL